MKTTSNPFLLVQGLCAARKVWAVLAFTRQWYPWPWEDHRAYVKALPHLGPDECEALVEHGYVVSFGEEGELRAVYAACGKAGPPVRYYLVGATGTVVAEGQR